MRRQGIEKQSPVHLRMKRRMIHLKKVAIVRHIRVGRHLPRKTTLGLALQNKARLFLYNRFRKRAKKWPTLRNTGPSSRTKTTPSSLTQNMTAHLFSKLKSQRTRRATASPWRSPSRITTTNKTCSGTNSLRARRTHLSISRNRAQIWHSKRCPSRHRASYSCWMESWQLKKTKCIHLMAICSSLSMFRKMVKVSVNRDRSQGFPTLWSWAQRKSITIWARQTIKLVKKSVQLLKTSIRKSKRTKKRSILRCHSVRMTTQSPMIQSSSLVR